MTSSDAPAPVPARARRTGLLGAAAVLCVASLVGCGTESSVSPREALRTVCGDDVEIVEQDPAPEDGYNDEVVGVGRLELVMAECGPEGDDDVYAARYENDPTGDMEDRGEAYEEADGLVVGWAVLEPGGLFESEWVVVYGPPGGVLDPLVDLGFERVSADEV